MKKLWQWLLHPFKSRPSPAGSHERPEFERELHQEYLQGLVDGRNAYRSALRDLMDQTDADSGDHAVVLACIRSGCDPDRARSLVGTEPWTADLPAANERIH